MDAKDFIAKCLVLNCSNRINLDQMLQHNFFTNNSIPYLLPVSTLIGPPPIRIVTFDTSKKQYEKTMP